MLLPLHGVVLAYLLNGASWPCIQGLYAACCQSFVCAVNQQVLRLRAGRALESILELLRLSSLQTPLAVAVGMSDSAVQWLAPRKKLQNKLHAFHCHLS